MENRVNTDVQSIKIIYNRNKHYIIPFIVIAVCIGLIIQFIIPQLRTLFEVREEEKNAMKRLTELKRDLDILSGLDEKTLELQLKTASFALPIGKDFGGLLTAIYSAANASGVSIGRFSFQVGDLAKSDDKDTKFSSIDLTINLENDIRIVSNFIDILGKTLPISDISYIKTDNKISTVSLLFYYKILSSQNVLKNARIVAIPDDKLQLLNKINGFNSALSSSSSSEVSTPISANPFAD